MPRNPRFSVIDALHDSPQGSTPGVAIAIYGHADPNAIQAAGAYLAMIHNDSAFAVLHVRPNGPDLLHQFHVPGSGEELRARLTRGGITNRVLVPFNQGWKVIVPDPGGRLYPTVRQFARQQGTQLETSRGHFKVVGDADQDRAREMFRGTLERMKRPGQPQRVRPTKDWFTGKVV